MAKLFIQKLWLMNLTWDTKLDIKLSHEWNAIVSRISTIKDIKIPRWISTLADTSLELHGFADASEKTYAAVVYAKTSNAITMLAAKSKVNPIKNKKTLPKLELCEAHLLGKLMKSIKEVINREVKIYAWSDSTIALSWIKNENKTKDKFIGTRVREIKQCMPSATWNHVRSEDNPADVASRGLKPEKLAAHSLWWNGPTWLKDESNWPTATESVLCGTNNINSSQNIINDIIDRYSNYRKLLYVIAYISRFIRKLKKEKFPVWLTVEELREAENIIIRHTQHLYFTKEINLIKNRRELPSGYKICSLYPFLDKNEILRVGGRLENSPFSFARKHPILLPKCHLTMLIVDDYHKNTLHGGIKLMENMLRRQYWIINARNIIKRYVRSCVRCIRYRRETATQLMGNLPENRVSISKPFEHAGIYYAGPVQMRVSKGRGQKSYKGYIAVFICMATKAIHLEAVSDLSTDAFLAALRRFFGRRGKSSHLYSDNDTNFVGAAKKIDDEYEKTIRKLSSLAGTMAAEKITWHFIPPLEESGRLQSSR
ncbi:uncharacterized protein LOC119684956 [Teleopsis dalmanni]|uniref:uncharacterized protein LOC119684956 n=1 Tax=Teleopsis dalmanni TaxID=139649 RepID=UPI0018CCF4D5|nr:uncharacterized protein LOC119684956 [Teleopsis dalmanni]